MAQSLKNAFHINSVTKSVEKVTLRALPNLENEHDYIWFQLDFLAEDVEDVLLSLGINEIMINALTKEDSRPRVDILQDELLLVVRGMNLIKGEKPEDMISVRILATKNLLITCQKKPLNSINDLIAEIGQGNPPRNTGDFIVRLNERLVMNMSEVMEDIEERAIEIEELVLDGERDDYKQELHNLQRQVIQLKRFLLPQRDALNKLQLDKTNWLTGKQQIRLREVGDYLMRYLEMLDASRDLAAVSQETLAHRQNEHIGKRMYLLSVIAALFLPLSFFTGLLGVNLAGIPRAENPNAFAAFVIILLVIVFFQIWFFRKNKWL